MIYLSGIPQLRGREARVFVEFDSDCVSISIPLGGSVRIPKEDLLSVQEKTEEQISKDVTLTRLLAFGIFAFGMKKKKKSTTKYLILSYTDSRQEITAVFKDHSQSVFRKLFNAVKEGQDIKRAKLASKPTPTLPKEAAPESILDQLSKLNDLRKEDAITEEEFNKLKERILGSQ